MFFFFLMKQTLALKAQGKMVYGTAEMTYKWFEHFDNKTEERE